jgi:heme exporter protein C
LLTAGLLSYALYQALVIAPTEQTMGDVQRIFYYHVPSAWTAFLLFFINFLASIQYLVRRDPQTDKIANGVVIALGLLVCVAPYAFRTLLPAGVYPSSVVTTGIAFVGFYFLIRRLFSEQQTDMLALTTAEVGVVFCTVVLVTGPLWARPVWGIWWTWDVRLTSTLVLWLIYVSYLLLRRFAAGPQVQTLAAVLGIFGALDVPIVYMSNRWWRTQHPAPVFGGDPDSGMKDPTMLAAFGWNMLAWFAWGGLILYLRYRVERKHQENAQQEALEALEAKI